MDVKELRIGNWFLLNKSNVKKPYQIDSGFDIYKLDESDCADIEPIPLTEEWLIKFGFEKKQFFSYDKGLLSVSLPSEDALLWRNGRTYFNSWKISDAPKYVHQLQNLYFALTGTELVVNN